MSFPENGTTKSVVIDDTNKWRHFLEKRMGQEVEADGLGEEFKGYVFKITGGYDSDGFAMKQGIFSNTRVRLLLKPGAKGYRAKRTGERKRKSVRGCIVGSDLKMLSCVVVKKGEKEIPGLTDEVKPRRLGPKRASGIRKLFGISKTEGEKTSTNVTALIKKNVIRRTFKSQKNPEAPLRQKAPKIQRLVTDVRIRRKRIQKEDKIKRWKKTLAATEEYKKLYEKWITKKKAAAKAERKASQGDSKQETKPVEVKKPVVDTKAKKTTEPAKKVDNTKGKTTTTPAQQGKTQPTKAVAQTKPAAQTKPVNTKPVNPKKN